MKQRLKALEKKSAEEGLVLTKTQIMTLEKKDDDIGDGEQDTFYVGNLKGAGCIYQQTFGTYSKMRYTTKTPITSVDLLNDSILLFLKKKEWVF